MGADASPANTILLYTNLNDLNLKLSKARVSGIQPSSFRLGGIYRNGHGTNFVEK